MARQPVSRSAVEASLWFMLGRSLPESAASTPEPVPEEPAAAVNQMLRDQGSAELEDEVLATIGAGLSALRQNPGLSLSAGRYDQLRREFLTVRRVASSSGKTLWPVGSTTILKRCGGSWSAALSSAGLAATESPATSGFGRARFSSEQFTAAVRDFCAAAEASGSSTSYQNYVQWRKQQQEAGRSDLPSGPAIRNRAGSWKAALEQAQ
ncbi:hypothetical protein [Nesterenkonia sp.]|uniref:hypothetical protein n=1 Tax=Nesterenkonia sp. TaxID=704201 RepID=UPI00262703D2|nr:hypothetical protein [Nesterenkonia sp.]